MEPTDLARWWLQFNDPMLSRLVEDALLANHSIGAALGSLAQARAVRDVAAAGLWPVVGSSASAQRNRGNDQSASSFRAGFDAGWELDVFGAIRQSVNAADANVIASNASLGDVQVSVAAEVALNYITVRTTQVRMQIASNSLATQLETLQITHWRLQAGLVSTLEDEQALTASEQTRAQLPTLQTQLSQAQYALALLTGRSPLSLVSALTVEANPAADATKLPMLREAIVPDIPVNTLRHRPDVRAAEASVQAAMARLAQADAARMPDFRLSGSLGLSALTVGALHDSSALVAALLASVSLPLLDGGLSRAQVHAQEAALKTAGANYLTALFSALKDVEDALVALRSDQLRLGSFQAAQGSARIAAQLARERYASGLVDFQTVLDTQRTELATRDGAASAAASVATDQVRLFKALGGGWHNEPAQTPQTNTAALF